MRKNLILSTLFTISAMTHCAGPNFIEVKNLEHHNELMNKKKPMILYFYADWCGVCKRVQPFVENQADANQNVQFLHLNGDNQSFRDLKTKHSVRGFPTFIFFDANGNQTGRVVGRNDEAFKKELNKIKKTEAPSIDKAMTPAVQPMPQPAEKKPMPAPTKPEQQMQDIKPVKKEVPAPAPISEGVNEVRSEAEFQRLKAQGKSMVLDFYTTWCGPCKTVKPIFQKLSHEYNDVIFIAVDAECVPSIANQYKITSYPTFIFIDSKGEVVDRFSGGTSDPILLQTKLNKISKKNNGLMIVGEEKEIVQGGPKQPASMGMQKMMVVERPMPSAKQDQQQTIQKNDKKQNNKRKSSRYKKNNKQ